MSGVDTGAAPRGVLPPAMAERVWKPGQSGNPTGWGGRYAEMRALAREASPKGIRKAIELIDDADPRVALVAIQTVLDRAWGKAKEAKDGEEVVRPTLNLSHLSREELEVLVKALSGARTVAPTQVVEGLAETPSAIEEV